MKSKDFDIDDLEVAATAAAGYIDACDSRGIIPDARRYQACAHALDKIFMYVDAKKCFPELMAQSRGARDAVESIALAAKIQTSVIGYCPDLALLIQRLRR
jgi:hypothetical protein